MKLFKSSPEKPKPGPTEAEQIAEAKKMIGKLNSTILKWNNGRAKFDTDRAKYAEIEKELLAAWEVRQQKNAVLKDMEKGHPLKGKATTEYEETVAKTEEIQKRLDKANEPITAFRSKYASLKKAAYEAEAISKEWEKSLKDATARQELLTNGKKRIDDLEHNLKFMASAAGASGDENVKLKAELEEAKKKIAKLEGKVATCNKTVSKMKTQIGENALVNNQTNKSTGTPPTTDNAGGGDRAPGQTKDANVGI